MPSPGFRNWSHTVRSTPTRWERPASVDEVADLVGSASQSGSRVKVVGAGHSFSAIAAPDQVALSLDGLTGVTSYDGETVRVRAGMRLHRLNAVLAERGLALPILGSIAQQSVAGAIATGTHGSSLAHGNLASLVTGMTLVDGRGDVVEVSAEQLPGTRVHLGALGVVTDVHLRVVPAFRLAQTVERVPATEVAEHLEQIGRSAEFVKVWWVPHTREALVFRYDRTEDPADRVSQVERSIDQRFIHPALLPAFYAINRVAPSTVAPINTLMAATLAKKRRVGASTLLFSTPDPVRHDETEAAIPLASGSAAWDALVRTAQRVKVNFIAELRFVQGDDGWLSPAYGGDVVQLGAYTAFQRDRDAYFEGFWSEMRDLGARPHWGKAMDHHTAADLAPLYPQWASFGALRDELDPQRVFANGFLDRVLG